MGNDLILELPITINEAHYGAKIKIPTLDGWLQIRIPSGSRGGERLRLKAKGIKLADGNRGDLYIHLCIRLPDRLEGAARNLERLDNLYSSPVRNSLYL
jgi:DnaJ-class molecular chaperone